MKDLLTINYDFIVIIESSHMHIFEYSGITENIPTDIAETIAKIESLRAMDHIRENVYAK